MGIVPYEAEHAERRDRHHEHHAVDDEVPNRKRALQFLPIAEILEARHGINWSPAAQHLCGHGSWPHRNSPKPTGAGYVLATSLSLFSTRLTRYALRLMDLNLIPSFIAFCATAPRVRRNFFAACVAESLAFARLRKLLTSSFDHADTLLRLLF